MGTLKVNSPLQLNRRRLRSGHNYQAKAVFLFPLIKFPEDICWRMQWPLLGQWIWFSEKLIVEWRVSKVEIENWKIHTGEGVDPWLIVHSGDTAEVGPLCLYKSPTSLS